MTKNDLWAMLFVAGLVAVQVGFILLHVASVGEIATWPMLKVLSPILGLLALSFGAQFIGFLIAQVGSYVSRKRWERLTRLREERQQEWERMQRDPKLSKRLN